MRVYLGSFWDLLRRFSKLFQLHTHFFASINRDFFTKNCFQLLIERTIKSRPSAKLRNNAHLYKTIVSSSSKRIQKFIYWSREGKIDLRDSLYPLFFSYFLFKNWHLTERLFAKGFFTYDKIRVFQTRQIHRCLTNWIIANEQSWRYH